MLKDSVVRKSMAMGIWIVLSLTAGILGSLNKIGDWYFALNKPSWNPPGWVFGPVWTALFITMGIAAWYVSEKEGLKKGAPALGMFLLQLVFNTLWSFIFFGLKMPGLAFMEIILLWLLIATTMILFWRSTRIAGILFIPYLTWVTFAAILNFTIWVLN